MTAPMFEAAPYRYTVREVAVTYREDGPPPSDLADLGEPSKAAAFILAWNAEHHPADVETFSVLGLDSRHRLIYLEAVTRGTANQAPVDGPAIFRRLLLSQSTSGILTHNHPSGDLTPSRDDLELTRRLCRGGELVGVNIVDHIITTADGRSLSLRSTRPDLFSV